MNGTTTKIETVNLNLYYGAFQAIENVDLKVPSRNVTALIGPSGCGKSTLLRSLNRMNDLIESCRMTGQILVDGQDILNPTTDLIALRQKVGMVFQRPNVFDLSIYHNLRFGLRIHGMLRKKRDILETIQRGLEQIGRAHV
jgi:phosphate transport system ATP-binding protein